MPTNGMRASATTGRHVDACEGEVMNQYVAYIQFFSAWFWRHTMSGDLIQIGTPKILRFQSWEAAQQLTI